MQTTQKLIGMTGWAQLIPISSDDEKGALRTLENPKYSIGKSLFNDIVLTGKCCSSYHAMITRCNDIKAGYIAYLVDNDSKNGTIINYWSRDEEWNQRSLPPKQPRGLRQGDRIYFTSPEDGSAVSFMISTF